MVQQDLQKNANMNKAKHAKNDEFYTQIRDIEKEVRHYRDHFRDKVVFLNCDDPEYSNFWKYFAMNFERLEIKRLVATHYANGTGTTYQLVIDRDMPETLVKNEFNYPSGLKSDLNGDGDFRSDECLEILKTADIVCTNPPFSLFREYVSLLMAYNKQFLLIGNQNAITYNEVFPFIKANALWLGHHNGNMAFTVPNSDEYVRPGKRFWIDDDGQYWRSLGNIVWFTNMDYPKRYEDIILFKKYNDDTSLYPRYSNYDAIDVSKVVDIPVDYDGCMGVPITFLHKYNPDQFDIVDRLNAPVLENGKRIYKRLIIRRK